MATAVRREAEADAPDDRTHAGASVCIKVVATQFIDIDAPREPRGGRAFCLSACRKLYAIRGPDVDRMAAMRALRAADTYADCMEWLGRVGKKLCSVVTMGRTTKR